MERFKRLISYIFGLFGYKVSSIDTGTAGTSSTGTVDPTCNIDPNYQEKDLGYTSPKNINKLNAPIPVPKIKMVKDMDSKLPTILMMDDFSGIISVLMDDLKAIKLGAKNAKGAGETGETEDTGDGESLLDNLNIVYADGAMAAFSVKQFLEDYKQAHQPIAADAPQTGTQHRDCKIKNIDIALLDITIGGCNYIDGIMVEYDGIDIAKFIKEIFPDCKIWFITGHKPNKRNPTIYKYMEKFRSFFGEDIDNYIIPKNSNRVDYFKENLLPLITVSTVTPVSLVSTVVEVPERRVKQERRAAPDRRKTGAKPKAG